MTALEQDVCKATQQLLEEYADFLGMLGLTAEFRGLQVVDSDPQRRTSEVEVVFYRGREFADIFEFFVLRDGEPLTSVYEVQEWLRRELDGLRARHGPGSTGPAEAG